MYSLEEIKKRIDKVAIKEKLSEEQTREFFTLLGKICSEILSPEEEPKTKTEPAVDIDELIKKRMKEDKIPEAKQLSISWFLDQGFAEVLDSGGDYYKTRNELLTHSKMLQVHPKSLDYLIIP
jgi:hypothetical protein